MFRKIFNLGEKWGVQDLSIHAFGSYFINGAESLAGNQTYARDTGHLLGLEVTGNFVHEPARAVGSFVRYSTPVSLRTEKFGKSRIDTLGLGFQSGFQISEKTQLESLLYYGSGYSTGGVRHQNASLVFSGLFGARFPGLLFSGVILKAGPFFEFNLTERSDSVYGTTGFRGYRVGYSTIGVITLTPSLGLELGYIQKLSGAYFRATKDLYASVGYVF